jgi:hypothetical protein
MPDLLVDSVRRATAQKELSQRRGDGGQYRSDAAGLRERSEQPGRPSPFDIFTALIGLAAIDLILAVRGFPCLYRIVKRWRIRQAPQATYEPVRRICEAVDRACVYYPKRALCLQRSALCTCLLRRKGVAARMVIAVRKLPFGGHAWVEVNGEVVNDSQQVQRLYSVLDRC